MNPPLEESQPSQAHNGSERVIIGVFSVSTISLRATIADV
jgi:hypothetical protein